MSNLLEVKNLRTQFRLPEGSFLAVDGVSLQVKPGCTLGIVGESGCGKSATALSIMRLIQEPGRILSGEILFDGQNLLKMSEEEMRCIRGDDITMIFQEPMTSLNPVFTCGHQIYEVVRLHQKDLSNDECKQRALQMLREVGMPSPARNYDEYPHEMSGGMRQRVMIAMALSCNPKLLIADEPTTALDVTIQAQILKLMQRLQKDYNASLILITHDLGVIAETCQDVAVMYAGQIIEYGSVDDIFYRPQHPYTRGLLNAIPQARAGKKLSALKTIPGHVPGPFELPKGCRFADRCEYRFAACDNLPALTDAKDPLSPDHQVACFAPAGYTKVEKP